jgi:outer membrane protein TolC
MRNDLYQARQRLRLTQRSLADLLDMPVSSIVLAPEGGAAPSFGEAATQAERVEERALQNRADVAALRWRSAAAQFAYREARRARYPWVKEISASYRSSRGSARGSESSSGAGHGTDTSGREQSGRGQTWRTETGADGTVLQTTENRLEHQATSGTSESWSTEQGETWTENRSDGDEWQVGLAVDVPIFTWFRNHADDVLLAERNLAVVREAEAERTAVREVRNAIEELEDCRREQARYASDVEPLVDEMKRTLAAMESAPGVMPEQLAMARLQCLESERIKIESAHRCREALIALERAAGAPLAEILPSVAPESKAPAAGK